MFDIIFEAIFSLISKPVNAALQLISDIFFGGVLLGSHRKNKAIEDNKEIEKKAISKGRRIVKTTISVLLVIACIAALWYQIGPGKSPDPLEKIPKLELLKDAILKKVDSSKH